MALSNLVPALATVGSLMSDYMPFNGNSSNVTSGASLNNISDVVSRAEQNAYTNWQRSETSADISRAFNERMMNKSMAFNAQQAAANRDWQEYMSNTAHQREVADLKAAGLNPVLSAGGTGSSVGSGATASVSSSGSSAQGQVDNSLNNLLSGVINGIINMSLTSQNIMKDIQVANIAADASMSNAQTSANAVMNAATTSANATMSAASMAAAASRYSADQSAAASRYSSDQHYAGTRYSSDQSYAGTKYAADLGMLGSATGAAAKVGQQIGQILKNRKITKEASETVDKAVDWFFDRTVPAGKKINGK